MLYWNILATSPAHRVSFEREILIRILLTFEISPATFGATLKFVVKDCDPTTGLPDSEEGYDDEYMLEDFEITVADQIQKTKLNNFVVAWDAADTEGENLMTFVMENFKVHFNSRMGRARRHLPAVSRQHAARRRAHHH